ncbi:MAG: methyltransferase domain-containing protein [Gammaproteobacteria bacterium]|nr:methyltransferase domain-containing protein [Gammaproteobacteria bacterium]
MIHPTIAGRTRGLAPWLCATLAAACGAGPAPSADNAAAEPSHYSFGRSGGDGTGKFYMGREIAWVMGHQGAGWLERDERVAEERTDLLLDNLPLEPDDVVADIGAGTGYFALPIAERVPEGRVLAVDIQQEMLDIIRERVARLGVDNVETVLATEEDPRLPVGEADLVLFVDAYHEFAYPREVMERVVAALKPGGRVVLVEYRGEDPTVPIRETHKMTERQARAEMNAVGLEWVETRGFLPWQHFMIFRKPAG